MGKKIFVLSTRNRGKLREFKRIIDSINLVTLDEIGFEWNIKEVGETFCENALIKARFPHDITGFPVISDDSGIVVPALGNSPGIYSARFAGENATDEENNKKLLKLVSRLPENQRSAYYFCCVAFCYDSRCVTFTGRVDGVITLEPRGEEGFGYDPLFYLPEYGRTMAELSPEEKDRISHRGRAIRKLLEYLKRKGLL